MSQSKSSKVDFSQSSDTEERAHRFRKPRLSIQGRETLAGYGFLLPNIVGFLVFTLLPVLASAVLSLYRWDIIRSPVFVGLGNYLRLFTKDPFFYKILFNTAYYTFISVPLGMVCSLVLALLVNQRLTGITWFRAAYFMPVVSSTVAVALIWRWLYNTDFGLVNSFLRVFGLPNIPWLTSTRWAMPALILMSIWKNMGYHMVIFLAGLQGIDVRLYEAAEIDGASRWGKFRYVTLPLLTPTIFFVLVTSVIGSFQVFALALVMTEGGPGYATSTLVLFIYNNAFQWFKMGYAAALAWILFAIVFIATLIQMRYQRTWVHYD